MYSLLGAALEKQTEKQIDALKFLNLELKPKKRIKADWSYLSKKPVEWFDYG